VRRQWLVETIELTKDIALPLAFQLQIDRLLQKGETQGPKQFQVSELPVTVITCSLPSFILLSSEISLVLLCDKCGWRSVAAMSSSS